MAQVRVLRPVYSALLLLILATVLVAALPSASLAVIIGATTRVSIGPAAAQGDGSSSARCLNNG
jgi:hypothetical protein